MKITRVEAIPLRLSSVTEDVDGTQDDLLIRVDTDEGIIGWGEVDSSPSVAKAVVDAPRSHGIACGLGELLIGRNPLAITELWREMYRNTIYFGRSGPALHAISGVEMALFDIRGKAEGKPVWELLGNAFRREVLAYASTLMPDSPREAGELASSFRRAGFRAMKFGWGSIGRDAVLDGELFEAVRQGAGPDTRVMFDAGQCYGLETALKTAEKLAQLDAFWFEEPLDPDDLESYARLCAESPVAIAAGEADSGPAAFRRLILQGGVQVIQPDLARCGGLSVARELLILAEENGRRVFPHAFKSNLLMAASLHFCAGACSAEMIEYSMSKSLVRQLTRQELPVVNGYVAVPQGPGLGVEPDPDRLAMLMDGSDAHR